MLNSLRFGAIIPIIGEQSEVATIARLIEKRGQDQGIPVQVERYET